jgi:hypothetical protein
MPSGLAQILMEEAESQNVMRSHREALALKWDAIDFDNDFIRVRGSKTRAGIRNVQLSDRCKTELLRWQEMLGPEFSPFVFPNMRMPFRPMKDIRHGWPNALEEAGLEYFWLYNLRHSYCSRLSAAGVPDLFVAQMLSLNPKYFATVLQSDRRVPARGSSQTRTDANNARDPPARRTPSHSLIKSSP